MSTESAPYMGVLSVERIENTENIELVSQVTYAPYLIRASLSSASYDTLTKKVIKGELLSSFLLTESQFGDLISLAGYNEGVVTTLQHMHGYSIVDNDFDPVKTSLSNLVDGFINEDSNVKRLFESKISDLEAAINKKRISVQDKKLFYVSSRSLALNMSSNTSHRYDLINEETTNRINQIKLELNSAISMSTSSKINASTDNNKLLLENQKNELKPVNKASLALLSFSGSGGGTLFNENDISSKRVVSISLSSTKDKLNKFKSTESFSKLKDLFKIAFSYTHTANFLRCDGSDIQCTITRLGNVGCGPVEPSHTSVASESDIYKELKSSSEKSLTPIYARLDELDEKMKATKPTNVNALKEMLDDLKGIQELYSELAKSESETRKQQVVDEINSQKDNLSDFFESEVNSLPNDLREKVQHKLAPFLSQHKLISKK